jgi:hypothetical protein
MAQRGSGFIKASDHQDQSIEKRTAGVIAKHAYKLAWSGTNSPRLRSYKDAQSIITHFQYSKRIQTLPTTSHDVQCPHERHLVESLQEPRRNPS